MALDDQLAAVDGAAGTTVGNESLLVLRTSNTHSPSRGLSSSHADTPATNLMSGYT